MKKKTVVLRLSVFASAIALLAGCGGGGGGGGGGTVTPTGGAIDGIAAKGILKKAKVTAYCGNSEAAADSLSTGVTNDTTGAYSLKWTAPCTKILKLVVELGTGTTMDDEATGQSVTPAAGFKLRAFVADPSTTAIKHITPFSDMAAAIVEKSGALTKASVSNAELAIITTVLGGDIGAYQAKPVAPTTSAMATASADEKKLATLLTAVSAFAQDDATCKAKSTDHGIRIKCATDAFAAQAVATVTGVSDDGYKIATTVPATTPASMLTATLIKITNGAITITAPGTESVSTDITHDTSGSSALLKSGEDKVATAAASPGGTVTVTAGSASGIQAARDLFNSLKNDLLALSDGNGTGFLDQKLSAAETDFSTNGHASVTGFMDYLTAINRATQMANDAKTANWTVAATSLQPNAAYPVLNSNVVLVTDSNGAQLAFVQSFFGFNIDNQTDNMTCKVLASEKTLGKAACFYSSGQPNVAITPTTTPPTFTGFFHAVEVAASTSASGTYTWQDYTASRTYTTTLYDTSAGFVQLVGNSKFVPAAASIPTSTKQSGTAVLTQDASGNVTAVTLKGDIQPLAAGQDKSTVDISAALTSTTTTQTANLSGTLTNVKGTATTMSMALVSGSQIVFALPTATANDHATSANLGVQLKTAASEFDGTLIVDSLAADKSGNFQPASASFTGKISTVANGTATEFMSGKLEMKQTNLATFDPGAATSASNFVKRTATFTGKVTNVATIYELTFIDDRSTFEQESITLNYTRNGTQMINVTGTKSATVNTMTISGSGNVNAVLDHEIGDVKIGTTKIGTITKHPSQVTFDDGTFLLLGI